MIKLSPSFATILTQGLLVLLLGVLLTGCAALGPQPVISGIKSQPPADASAPYTVQVIIENTGAGDGEVGVSLRLLDKRNGETVVYDMQRVDLVPGERQSVNFSEDLPPGAPPADQLTVQANTEYPIK